MKKPTNATVLFPLPWSSLDSTYPVDAPGFSLLTCPWSPAACCKWVMSQPCEQQQGKVASRVPSTEDIRSTEPAITEQTNWFHLAIFTQQFIPPSLSLPPPPLFPKCMFFVFNVWIKLDCHFPLVFPSLGKLQCAVIPVKGSAKSSWFDKHLSRESYLSILCSTREIGFQKADKSSIFSQHWVCHASLMKSLL